MLARATSGCHEALAAGATPTVLAPAVASVDWLDLALGLVTLAMGGLFFVKPPLSPRKKSDETIWEKEERRGTRIQFRIYSGLLLLAGIIFVLRAFVE